MSRTAQPFVRPLSIRLASTAMMVGYSQMTIATAAEPTAAAKPAATVPAGANPLLAPWTGPYEGVPPWDKMDPELFPDAFVKGMAETKAEVQAEIDNPEAPTFENTHVPMMLAGDTMDRIFAMWGVQTSNRSEEHTSELQSLMRNSYAVFCLK